MEFLSHIRISNSWHHLDEVVRERVQREEREAAARLRAESRMQRMWRDPCRLANYILWRVNDANELHEIISTLPAYPWFEDVTITMLSGHPVDPLSYEL